MEPSILNVAKYSYIISFCLTWILTLTLLYLIRNKTELRMKKYAKILCHSTILDLFSTCGFFFCQTQLGFKGSYFFSRSGSFFPTFEGKLKCIYPMLYGVFYNLSFLPIPLQCLYRYFCLYRNQELPKWIIISLYLGILSLLIPTGYYYVAVFDPIESDPGGFAVIKSLHFWENASGIERFCVTELSSPGVYVYCLFLNIIAICGLITIFYTSHKCYYFLKTHISQMTTKTLQMHSELGQRLILQGILPLFYAINTIFLCSAIYILPDFGGGLYLYIFLPYPWQAVINCVVTIISIRSYRFTILSWAQCLNVRNKISSNNSGNIAVIPFPERS